MISSEPGPSQPRLAPPPNGSTSAPLASPSSSYASSPAAGSSSGQPPYYTFSEHPEHEDDTVKPRPLEPVSLPRPAPSLREAPAPDIIPPVRPTLAQFRQSEGPASRSAKLRGLWEALPATLPELGDGPTATQSMKLPGQDTKTALSPERAERLRKLYEEELVQRCKEERPEARLWGGADEQPDMRDVLGKGISFESFRRFLWDQERELWDTFQEIDKNGDGRLDATELRAALARSGIDITPETVRDLVRYLSSGANDKALQQHKEGKEVNVPEDMYITFGDFRDFLIMLPRRATPFEIYKFYQVRKRFTDGRGAARVDKEGDLNVSFPKRPPPPPPTMQDLAEKGDTDFADQVDGDAPEEKHEAWRFLLAGGIAGAVSRTVTAPFDRLKIYLITTDKVFTPASSKNGTVTLAKSIYARFTALHNLSGAMVRIYKDGGGVRAFWVGNGLNVTKIFPESAIKFVSYEQSKKFLAKYWDKVSDPSELSSSSRFIAGGIGGITSQLSIYGLETLKTRVQSEVGPAMGWRQVLRTAKNMWLQGGLRTYYRGLTLGLIGVFPYSAIDMGTYETLRVAYCRSMNLEEAPVYAVLSFGALSGSIGAASVYPINLLRTRLQASGSSGHPHKYTGFGNVLRTTLANEGWRGLYKGLLPTILKVGPAVGVSYIVYEDCKRKLGV